MKRRKRNILHKMIKINQTHLKFVNTVNIIKTNKIKDKEVYLILFKKMKNKIFNIINLILFLNKIVKHNYLPKIILIIKKFYKLNKNINKKYKNMIKTYFLLQMINIF